MNFKLFITLFFLLSAMCNIAEAQEGQALSIYEQQKELIYQIRVIDNKSQEKATIGSGFLIEPDGNFITNYHVISKAVQEPDNYRIEFLHEDGSSGDLTILNIDVAHDIAILSGGDGVHDGHLLLGTSELSMGEQIFSMGNPHDLGMTIIDGIYNGLLEKSVYKKILFSGALNSGMSGGPGFNSEGRVIGVNVSTGGDDLSYLVPIEYLRELIYKTKENRPWKTVIEEQILLSAENIINDIAAEAWDEKEFGVINIPDKISPFFKCWGDGHDEKDETTHSHAKIYCTSQDGIYLTPSFSTGKISYSLEKIETKKLSSPAFSKFYSGRYSDIMSSHNSRKKKDVTEFNCYSNFINLADKAWKAAICSRGYTDYTNLHDTFMTAALLEMNKQGYIIEIWMEGFSQEHSKSFIKKFLGAVK